jgi:hypothetical protein
MKFLVLVLFLTLNLRAEDTHSPHDEHGPEHAEESAHEEDEEHHGEEQEASSSVGPGNAVPEANSETGFKLSEKALRTLGLQLETIQPQNTYTLSRSAIVYFKDEAGVYRLRDGWFKLVQGDTEAQGSQVRFTPKESFQNGDQIVVKGVPLLRVADLDAFGGSGEGHAH